MATAVLNLSELNNELPILPSVTMIVNNQEAQLVRYDNYQFSIKTLGKQAACFTLKYLMIQQELNMILM